MPTWDQPEDEADLLTIPEAARHLKVSRVTVWRWVKNHELEAVVLPKGGYRIQRLILAEFLKTHTSEPNQADS
jgi:excisionase family DNA binding protein